jgi:hypothetical protein
MRWPTVLALLALAVWLQAPAALSQEPADEAPERTFRAEVYQVPDVAASEGLRVERLKERPADLGVWLKGTPKKLQTVTVTPGDRGQLVKQGDLTFRVSGLYRGAQKDRMLLKVSFDEGGQAAVKEFMLGLDETAAVHYPLHKGGEILVLLVST